MMKRFLFVVVLFLASCAPKNTKTAPTPTQLAKPTSVKTSLDSEISTPTSLPEIEVGVVTVNTLNVRKGPGVNFPIVGSLNQNEKFYILGETRNSTSNRWLLISLADNSFGWVTGDQSHVKVQKEAVDADTYSTWQKNVTAARSLIPVTSP